MIPLHGQKTCYPLSRMRLPLKQRRPSRRNMGGRGRLAGRKTTQAVISLFVDPLQQRDRCLSHESLAAHAHARPAPRSSLVAAVAEGAVGRDVTDIILAIARDHRQSEGRRLSNPQRDFQERLARQKTPAARWGAVIGTLWNRPSSIKDLWALQEKALIGTDRLGRFLLAMIEKLAPPATS